MANHRRNTAAAASIFYFLTIPFLILVIIGNTHINSILNDIYFFQLDVSQVIPISVENSNLLNSVARSLGLHDFYQVGLWNFCEGYLDEGVTFCSDPKTFYWFNPVEILVSELLAGAQIALPSQAVTVLNLLKLGSRIMYGFFMAGICVNFVLIFLSYLVDQLNIRANIGMKMFAFMWIATIFTDVAFLLHAAMGCCCKPDRRQASSESPPAMEERRHRMPLPNFVRQRRRQATSS
ncbi:hypothetical protein ACJZ2D_011706 [Fusarium nematophilum]